MSSPSMHVAGQKGTQEAFTASRALQNPDGSSIRLDERFISTHRRNLDWLLDRLAKSTADVRGLIASTPHLTSLGLNQAEGTSQLSPTIVAIIAQGYASYFQSLADQGSG